MLFSSIMRADVTDKRLAVKTYESQGIFALICLGAARALRHQ